MLTLMQQQLEQRLTPSQVAGGDSCRVFHGRGKCFLPIDWCNVDFFVGLVIITIYAPSQSHKDAADGERAVDVHENILADIVDLVTSQVDKVNASVGLEQQISTVLMQRRDQSGAPVSTVRGDLPEVAYAQRGPLRFLLSFGQQNVGYFLDIEPVRRWLEDNVNGAKVLNLFSYTCVFSVVAKAAGADSVVNIDLSRKSLEKGRENHRVNDIDDYSVRYLAHDILKSWGKLKKMGPYGVVIIDPPSFQKGSFVATKDYRKVLNKMPDLVASGGAFVACLNAPELYLDDFKTLIDDSCPGFIHVESLTNQHDFPESDAGRNLKMLVYRRVN